MSGALVDLNEYKRLKEEREREEKEKQQQCIFKLLCLCKRKEFLLVDYVCKHPVEFIKSCIERKRRR